MATGESTKSGNLRELPEPDFLYEIVDGEITEVPRMGAISTVIANLASYYMNQYGIAKKIGIALVEVLFRIKPDGNARRPDVAFLRFDRYQISEIPKRDRPTLDVVPNLALEVVSPTNTAAEIEEKIHEYFEAGVELIWVIYPAKRRIYVYESAQKSRILHESDELDGGTVLPGFQLPVHALFKVPQPETES